MADIKSPEARSKNMAAIKGKETKPEEMVRKYLFHHGFRYRKNVAGLPGTPDIVLPKYKTIVFVNGCFWHKHDGCKYFVWPQNNANFWRQKILKNVERDQSNRHLLNEMGWKVLTVWECELKSHRREETLRRVVSEIIEVESNNKKGV